MLTVKASRKERSKGNLKKSLSFGGAMAGFAMGLGLTVSIPLYFHIQELLKEAINQAFDLSKWLLELARMLGIEPGEDFEAELSNGYTLVVDSINDDGSGTIILKKNGSLSTIIINIDKYGNMTSAGEVSGPGAQEIIDIINGAQDIIGEESSAIDGILDTINNEIDYTSLRIEYASRKNSIEEIIDDNLTELKDNYTPSGMDVNEWYDLGLMAHLSSKFKVQEKAMTSSSPAEWSIDLNSPNGDKPSAVERGEIIADGPWNVENIEQVYGFITGETADGFEFIASEIAKIDAYNTWIMTYGSDEDREGAIGDAGSDIDDAVSDIEDEKNDAADREDDMIADADEAKNDAINEAAVNDPGILDKLLVNPQTWMAAYIQTFGYTDNNDSSNDKGETTTLRSSIKNRLISDTQGDMSEHRFDMLDTELKRIMQLDPNTGKSTTKIKVSQLANTYGHEDAVTATLYALRFVATSYDDSYSSEVMVAQSSVLHINDFDTHHFYDESDAPHNIILGLGEIYLSGYSDYTQRQAIINMKKFSTGVEADYEDVKSIQDDNAGTNFENFANAFAWATRQRGDENLLKQTLAFEMLDAIADRFYFGGKAILLDWENFEEMMEVLEEERKANIEIDGNWITGIYTDAETYSDHQKDVLESFKDSTKVNITKLSNAVTDFMSDPNTQMITLKDNGHTFTSFTLASDPEDYLATLRLLITLENYERVTTIEYWGTADKIINDVNVSIPVRSQTLRDIIYFAGSAIDINDPDSLDKIEAGAGVGGELEENTGLNPDQIGEITDGINEVILADLLTLDELREVVKYTETVFVIIPDETDAFNKLKTVLDPNTIAETIDGEKYSGIEKITILNEWVDDLTNQGVKVTVDAIENYVWHKDPVESLDVSYSGAWSYRPILTGAVYSESSDTVYSVSHDGTKGLEFYSIEKQGSSSVTNRYSANASAPSTYYSNPAIDEWDGNVRVLTATLAGNAIEYWDPINNSARHATASGSVVGNIRGTQVDSNGIVYAISENGAIYKSNVSLRQDPTSITWTQLVSPQSDLNRIYGSSIAQDDTGRDLIFVSNNGDGLAGTFYADNGQRKETYSLGTTLPGTSPDTKSGFVYGVNPLGDVYRVDINDLSNSGKIVEIEDLEPTENISGEIWGSTDVSNSQFEPSGTGFRSIFYNPGTTEITIFGYGSNDRDIYLPNKSIELNEIFNYLVL